MTKRKDGPRRAPRTYTREFRQEAVRLMLERRAAGVSLAQISRELEVSPDLLRTWGKELGVVRPVRDGRPASAPGLTPEEELRRVRRELEVTRQERDFLKKAVAFFAKESR
jgi:transposase